MGIPITEYPGISLPEEAIGVGAQNMVYAPSDGIVRRIEAFQRVIIVLQKRQGKITAGYPDLPFKSRHLGAGGKNAITNA
jgi:hypothetical protein